jgi:hypothetical protein
MVAKALTKIEEEVLGRPIEVTKGINFNDLDDLIC